VCENGIVVENHLMVLVIMYLLNLGESKSRVLLPAWAPDFMDEDFKNLEIVRTKFKNFKAKDLKDFDFIATTNGNYTFTEFSLNNDAIYSSFKILELMALYGLKIGDALANIKEFYYIETKIECPSGKKGKMMRKFLEDAKDKSSSHLDGVKIWLDNSDWILMIPAQHSETLDIYIQAKSLDAGDKILKEYQKRVKTWINE
jgi:mannose-1-phosphate guanylyltransferase/phosphomannomutase